jgi:hypothetical protein
MTAVQSLKRCRLFAHRALVLALDAGSRANILHKEMRLTAHNPAMMIAWSTDNEISPYQSSAWNVFRPKEAS